MYGYPDWGFLCVLCCSVYMCTVLLPPGGYPIAVKKYVISYNTVLKKELLKRILLLGFKLGWSIAMILYIATKHEFQVASHPYLD